ncbi:uncharacterized protein LOC121799324 isoform X1 [Salvia splendens]|uniref:uncharacterized protein LOC121799324 isoform X1 n=1 Tax=Salvia splendens TaxID=180675 RepID=UPI001C2789DE|nr:uncharacterized protein LOC121799324 isoform X1 [Salvia splendens]
MSCFKFWGVKFIYSWEEQELRISNIFSVLPSRSIALRTLSSLCSMELWWHFSDMACCKLVRQAPIMSVIMAVRFSNIALLHSCDLFSVSSRRVWHILYIEFAAKTLTGHFEGLYFKQPMPTDGDPCRATCNEGQPLPTRSLLLS